MAGLADMLAQLSKPGDWLSEHPGTEEILGALPAIAGAYLLSRPQSRMGTPLGAALGTAGGLLAARGYKDSEAMAKKKEDAATRASAVDALKQAYPAQGPPAPLTSALPTLVGGGFDPSTALSVAKAEAGPKGEKPEYDYWFNEKTGEERALPKGSPQPGIGWTTSSFKPPKVSTSQNIYAQAAGELGLPEDPSKWSQKDRLAIRDRINRDKAAGTAAAGGTELKQVYDKKTGTTSWTYVPKSGPAGTTVGEVRPPLGANPVADAEATTIGLDDLKNQIKSLGLSSSQMGTPNWMTVFRQKAGFAASDKRVTDMLAQVSIINTTLTGLVMRSWGSRNPTAAQEVIDLHVPKATDSPKLLNQKIDWWQRVGLKQYQVMMGANAPEGATEEEPPDGSVPLD